MRGRQRACAATVMLLLAMLVVWAAQEADGGRVLRTPEPPAHARLGDVWVSPNDGAEMVYVPAGEFIMGSADSDRFADPNEKPQFRAHLPGYWIDKRQVTVARYRRFCRETGREMPREPLWGWREDHPVVNVRWHDAAAYAEWAGKRLPTEMEWEKAARGADGRLYPWGDEWDADKCANTSNSRRSTKPVGDHPAGASPYGALDLAGNVWEWCADWYDQHAYQRYAKGDLTPPSSGTYRVLRGGFWGSDKPRVFRSALRRGNRPGYRAGFLGAGDGGLRCARDASPPAQSRGAAE